MTITSSDPSYRTPTDASRIRDLLVRIRRSAAAVAGELEIEPATFRSYVSGKARPPHYVMLALERLVDLEVRV